MIRFNSDYTEGAHPEILEALIRTTSCKATATAPTRTAALRGR